MNKKFISLGLMSGTSLDGIDASIIKSDGEEFIEIIDDLYIKYDDVFKSKLKKIIQLCVSKEELSKMSKEIKLLEKKITLHHAKACEMILKRNKSIKIDLIGFHGQTFLHKPEKGYSIQIGDAQLLSNILKTLVISNFRKNDILNGGQGAPLAPLYHQLILKKIRLKFPLAIINIGGISNITYLEKKDSISSFDTGPGNYLLDKWVKINSKLEYDNAGIISKSGIVNKSILNAFLNEDYYKKKPPKSLDVKNFNLKKLNKLSFRDGCATLSMITVSSICLAVKSLKKVPHTILISGGGR